MRRIEDHGPGRTRLTLLAFSAFILFFTSVVFVVGIEAEDSADVQNSSSVVDKNCDTDRCNANVKNGHGIQGKRILTALHNQFSALGNP